MSNAAMSQAIRRMAQAEDPKQAILDAIGHEVLDGIKMHEDDVLLGTYIPPEKTKGGIILTERAMDENRFQGKVGLLLKSGPTAWKYDRSGQYAYDGTPPQIGDWLIYRASDGWEIGLNGVSCRLIRASLTRSSVQDPSMIW